MLTERRREGFDEGVVCALTRSTVVGAHLGVIGSRINALILKFRGIVVSNPLAAPMLAQHTLKHHDDIGYAQMLWEFHRQLLPGVQIDSHQRPNALPPAQLIIHEDVRRKSLSHVGRLGSEALAACGSSRPRTSGSSRRKPDASSRARSRSRNAHDLSIREGHYEPLQARRRPSPRPVLFVDDLLHLRVLRPQKHKLLALIDL